MIRLTIALVLLGTLALGAGVYVGAGRASGPAIEIRQPTGFVGREFRFETAIDPTEGELTAVTVTLEQGDNTFSIFSLDQPGDAEFNQEGDTRIRVSRNLTRESYAQLASGPFTLVVNATRSVLFGLRERSSTAQVNLEARFDPPRISVVSSFHYINHGGAEVVVYRVTPPDVDTGVRVGDRRFRGFPAAAAGVDTTDNTLRVALFALLHDQELDTPIRLYARDLAGNETEIDFEHRVFPRQFRRSRIAINDRFLERVVPAIVTRSEDFRTVALPPDAGFLEQYLAINGELRRRNADRIRALAAGTAASRLWTEPFLQLSNSQVESGFADHRTYLYNDREVDQQIHLGFDLAVTANVPILAANAGQVVWADYLGIYGNCVIIDHGLGLHSLYAHLSSITVQTGQPIERNDELGLSGMTGLAGGDHLHFAMLLNGWPISPTEWWDPHWIDDRVNRKLLEAQ